jgi:quercetin dioxygenase-like cupin family protein
MKPRFVAGCAVLCLFFVAAVSAQDPVKVDPKHYKVEMENDQVRILRVHYGAGEKSVMHSHPNTVAVFLSDGKVKFTYADGKTQDASGKAGQAMYAPATVHNPENVGDASMDILVIELKGAAASTAKK